MRTFPQRPLTDSDSIVWASCCAAKEDEPLENVLHTIKLKMQSIVDIFDRGLSGTVYLTSLDKEENYRYKLATIRPYKGNRKQEKPRWFQEARDYLCYAWGAQIVKGMEADDAISIEQWRNKDRSTVCISIDKDLDNVPGFHFNWRKQLHYYVTLNEANYNFYKQVLVGDSTDNIEGCKGIGPKTAEKLLAPSMSIKDMHRVCLEQYRKVYGDDGDSNLEENAKLLWMLREPGVMWAPP